MLCTGLPSSVRLCFGQRCSPARNGRFARPCDTPLVPASRFGLRPQGICSTYTYMSSGRSPARLVSFSQVPLRCGPKQSRAWHLWSSSSRSVAPRPRSRSPRHLSRRLHGVTRRNASSAEYHLLALRRVPPRIRRTEPSRVAQLATRHAAPLPHYMLNPFKPHQQLLITLEKWRGAVKGRGQSCSFLRFFHESENYSSKL